MCVMFTAFPLKGIAHACNSVRLSSLRTDMAFHRRVMHFIRRVEIIKVVLSTLWTTTLEFGLNISDNL
jgi:hypothetical protein